MPRHVQRLTTTLDADDAFLNWLAGFADGEGCFFIAHNPNHGTGLVQPGFVINLRLDDTAILEECCRRIGVGRVNYPKAQRDGLRKNAKPQARWGVESVEGCRRLVSIFDAHPLRAKKARDYAIWREAVLVWQAREPGWKERVLALKAKLMDVRVYPDAKAV